MLILAVRENQRDRVVLKHRKIPPCPEEKEKKKSLERRRECSEGIHDGSGETTVEKREDQ